MVYTCVTIGFQLSLPFDKRIIDENKERLVSSRSLYLMQFLELLDDIKYMRNDGFR